MMRIIAQLYILVVFIMGFAGIASSEPWEKYDQPIPTKISVRILAHGAKAMYPRFGAHVIIRNAETNEILSEGDVQGGSGDTDALMKAGYPRTFGRLGLTRQDEGIVAAVIQPEARGRILSLTPENIKKSNIEAVPYLPADDAANFLGTIQISKPTVVRIEAVGPLKYPQATMTDSITTLILPGKHIEGQGIVLNLRGLVVDIVSPEKNGATRMAHQKELPVLLNMSMMCGCPIFEHPNNPWHPGMFIIYVEAYYNGNLYYDREVNAKEMITDVSTFRFTLPLPTDLQKDNKPIKLRVIGAQPELANYGMDEIEFMIQ
jgi:hypothetical protein